MERLNIRNDYYDSERNVNLIYFIIFEIITKHRLILQLTRRDLNLRYQRSILGIWWSLLNPILTTLVLYFVFRNLFLKQGIIGDSFLIYLFTGVLMMNLFIQGINGIADNVTSSGNLLTKVYLRPEVIALSSLLVANVNFLFGLIPLSILVIVIGNGLTFKIVMLPAFLLLFDFLILGIGLLCTILYIEFGDSRNLISIILMLTQYLTPVFYSINSLDEKVKKIINFSPLNSHLEILRSLLGGTSNASLNDWLYGAAFSMVFVFAGFYLFRKWWKTGVTKI